MELRQRLPLAAAALDLSRGRKRRGWKRDFLAAVREAAGDLGGLSEKQLANTIRAYRRERGKSGLSRMSRCRPGPDGGLACVGGAFERWSPR